MISKKPKEYLDRVGVRYTAHSRRPAYTSQEIAQSLHIPGGEMVKSLILEADEKELIMAVVSSNDRTNLDVLREEIGCGRLPTEMEFTGVFPACKPGAMPPFGNIFNLPTFCQLDLSQNLELEFNAGSHDETVRMRFADYKRLVDPNMIHFTQPYRSGVQQRPRDRQMEFL